MFVHICIQSRSSRCLRFDQSPFFVLRLVFSQSLISLDLIEDFLELSSRGEDSEKPSPYKGEVSALLVFLLVASLFIVEVLKLLKFHNNISNNEPLQV